MPDSQKIHIFWRLKLFRFSAPWLQQGDIIGCVYIVDSYSNVDGKQAWQLYLPWLYVPHRNFLNCIKNNLATTPDLQKIHIFGVLNFSGLVLLGCNKETL
jgi:hypothetical protein